MTANGTPGERGEGSGRLQTPLRKSFGMRLRALRHARMMSQRALAEASHVSMNTIGSIERGQRFPSPEVLEALARALGVEVRDLFEFDAEGQPMSLEGAVRELRDLVRRDMMPALERVAELAGQLLKGLESGHGHNRGKASSISAA